MTVLPISAVILTYNEENNIRDCLDSVHGWISDIYVVDSYSTDGTLQIVREYTDKLFQHPFENYSVQRNWALENLPIETDWVLNLDADHRVTGELKAELKSRFNGGVKEEVGGFLTSRRTVFMGRWIKHGGHYPAYHCVLFKKGVGFCEDRLYDQHFIVRGKVETLTGDIIDIVSDSLSGFVKKHDRWAALEADEQLSDEQHISEGRVRPDLFGNPIQRKRFLRELYGRFPLFLRAFVYFLYRYIFRLGFLDGKEGLIFHVLQGFWYRFLVDSKMYELKKKNS